MTIPPFTEQVSARLRLRHFHPADLAAFWAYRNDPELARYQSWFSYSEDEAQNFIAAMQVAQPGVPGEWFQFAIALMPGDTLIGDCALQVQADDSRQAEIGFTLASAYQGQGLASEAVAALLDYGFHTLNLHRIFARCDTRNSGSYRLLERVGMRREGHFRQNYWFKDGWTDEYLYALLQSEWQARLRA